jgi:hypothetical protein
LGGRGAPARRATLDVPRELVTFLASLLAANRRARGTRNRTRALGRWGQALFVLVWFRERRDVAITGKGFGISQATAYRYLDEAIDVLAAQAPELPEALGRVADEGWSHVILDGKIVDADRCRTKTISRKGKVIDVWYSGKTHDFGGNIQALMRPDGFPLWISDVVLRLGPRHHLRPRARPRRPVRRGSQRQLPTLADPGYEGAGAGVYTPVRQPADGVELDVDTPQLQHAAAIPAPPRRTRLRPARRTLAHPAAHNRQPQQDRKDRQGGARPHPLRARLPQLLREPHCTWLRCASW